MKKNYVLTPLKKIQYQHALIKVAFAIILGLIFINPFPKAYCVGKRRPVAPSFLQAVPLRFLAPGVFRIYSFNLPNQAPLDLNLDFPVLAASQINQSELFRLWEVPQSGSITTERHGVVSLEVSSLELNLFTAGIQVGYRFGQAIPQPSDVRLSGRVGVEVGEIALDARIYDSETFEVYGATTARSSTTVGRVSFSVDFGAGSLGPELQFKQAISDILRRLVAKAMLDLGKQSRINLLPWQRQVTSVDLAGKKLQFSGGVSDRLNSGEVFNIYKTCSEAQCFPDLLGQVVITRVLDQHLSEARFMDGQDQQNLSHIAAGDIVSIHYGQVSSP